MVGKTDAVQSAGGLNALLFGATENLAYVVVVFWLEVMLFDVVIFNVPMVPLPDITTVELVLLALSVPRTVPLGRPVNVTVKAVPLGIDPVAHFKRTSSRPETLTRVIVTVPVLTLAAAAGAAIAIATTGAAQAAPLANVRRLIGGDV